MLNAKLIRTKLEKENAHAIKLILETNNWEKRDFLKEALLLFGTKVSKINKYELQHNEFDRLYLNNYSVLLLDDLFIEINQLATKLQISRPKLLREILLNYLNNKTMQ